MSTMNITFKHPDEIIDFLKTVCKFDFNMDMKTIAQNLKDS